MRFKGSGFSDAKSRLSMIDFRRSGASRPSPTAGPASTDEAASDSAASSAAAASSSAIGPVSARAWAGTSFLGSFSGLFTGNSLAHDEDLPVAARLDDAAELEPGHLEEGQEGHDDLLLELGGRPAGVHEVEARQEAE